MNLLFKGEYQSILKNARVISKEFGYEVKEYAKDIDYLQNRNSFYVIEVQNCQDNKLTVSFQSPNAYIRYQTPEHFYKGFSFLLLNLDKKSFKIEKYIIF